MAVLFFSHTVQLTANWHGCSLLLLLLLLLLSGLQPSPPIPKLHNTTSRCRKHRRACLINMDLLPEDGGGVLGSAGPMGGRCASEYLPGGVCLYPMRRDNAEEVLSYSWCVSQGEKSRQRTANRARWHLITKGKHKEAPQPAAGLLEGRVGVIQRVHETNRNHFHTSIYNTSHPPTSS